MSSALRDSWIDEARSAKLEDVLTQRGILKTLKGRNAKQLAGPCPVCGGRDRFAVDIRRGLFNCRGCQKGGGDAIALVQFLDDCDFLRAVETLAGPAPDGSKETEQERHARERRATERREKIEHERIEREAREAAELQDKLRCCDELWRETVPLPPSAIAYFAGRAIDINAVRYQGGLRFLSQCPFDGLMLPCILARFTDAMTNAPGGIWRRPISGEKPKSLGPVKNHVIRLWPDEYVEQGLCLGEGIETTLSAALREPYNNTLQPAWAAGFAGNIAQFPVLPGVDHLTIFADNDTTNVGQEAARTCARRWESAGRQVAVLIPKKSGQDFNDIAGGRP